MSFHLRSRAERLHPIVIVLKSMLHRNAWGLTSNRFEPHMMDYGNYPGSFQYPCHL